MKIRFFFKETKTKRFFYSPRYYDERKERLEKKKALYKNIDNISEEQRKQMLRDQIQYQWNRSDDVKQQRSAANSRTLILILAIIVLGYFIYSALIEFTLN